MSQPISIKIGGAAGQGVKTSGYILTKALKDLGHWTFSYSEYPSLIRGGHSTFHISISSEQIHSIDTKVNILVALDNKSIDLHYKDLKKEALLLCDDDSVIDPKIEINLNKNKVKVIKIPVDEIVKQNNGLPVMKNSVIVGAVWALLTDTCNCIEKQLEKIFTKKGKDIKANLASAQDGFNFVKQKEIPGFNLKAQKNRGRIIGTGNEVAGLATYASGCRMFCAYPMTPATGILHYLAARTDKTQMVIKQAEDEITAIQMALGGSFAGTRSACATSGGGLALMTETLSLIGITEIPLVVFNSQRPGPATGVPTWTEQGDLDFVVHAGHGEFPRIVVAPGDIDEVFRLVPHAFNFADKFQTVIIVLLDKYLSESWYQSLQFKDNQVTVKRGQLAVSSEISKQEQFKRYKLTASGISPRSLPGMKRGVYCANSDEHDEVGYTTEESDMRNRMMDKRMAKLKSIKSDIPSPELIGNKNAKTTIICWGSQKGPVVDAIKELNNVNVLHYSFVYPLQDKPLKQLMAKGNKFVIVENNFSGQFAKLIKQETGIEITNKVLKSDGRPFFRDELIKKLQKII